DVDLAGGVGLVAFGGAGVGGGPVARATGHRGATPQQAHGGVGLHARQIEDRGLDVGDVVAVAGARVAGRLQVGSGGGGGGGVKRDVESGAGIADVARLVGGLDGVAVGGVAGVAGVGDRSVADDGRDHARCAAEQGGGGVGLDTGDGEGP